MTEIRVTARCRVDLAGGTLDIWPLGLLHPGASTVNVAIDLPVRVALAPCASGWSVEQGGEVARAVSRAELGERPEAALVALVLEELDVPPCAISIASASPRGAGLGASSALTVALIAAAELARAGRLESDVERRAALARDLEARLMGLPTGRQDHFPAQLGGVLAIHHQPGGERVERMEVDVAALGARLVVAYTGQSHFSAGNNWQIVRRRLDGDEATCRRLDAVRDAARDVAAALARADWAALGEAMSVEWQARRGLAPGISTPQTERLLDAARTAGALGGKACGAGGGGSVAILTPPERRAEVIDGLRALDARVLEAAPTERGLETEIGEG